MSMLEAFNDPQMRHAAVVHLPVALSVLGVPVAAGAALTLGRRAAWRWATIGAYGLLLVTALLAVKSGQGAHDSITTELPAEAYELIEKHESMAEKTWIFAAAVLVLSAATLPNRRRVQAPSAVLAFLAAGGAAGWVGVTAHHGGSAVYEWGVGTPALERRDAPIAAVDSSDPRDVFFVQRVRPILEGNCWRCHNPSKRRGRLDQTTMAGLLEGGVTGPALVPGLPEMSLMIDLVRSADEDTRMPPDDELTEEQIRVLEQWILDGAAWVDVPGAQDAEDDAEHHAEHDAD